MDIRGLGNGLAVFHIEVRIAYRTRQGYEGMKTFPTMYTVGGNANDAIFNALNIIMPGSQIRKPSVMEYVIVRALPADPNSDYVVTTYDSRNPQGFSESSQED